MIEILYIKNARYTSMNGAVYYQKEPRRRYELSTDDWDIYINLIEKFAKSKEDKDYANADEIKKELAKWQVDMPDQNWISMYKSGKYYWHPVFNGGLPKVTETAVESKY